MTTSSSTGEFASTSSSTGEFDSTSTSTSTSSKEAAEGWGEGGDTWLPTGCAFTCVDLPPAPSACSLVQQDCPAGGRCIPRANDGGHWWNSVRCVDPSPDPAQLGEPCTYVGGEISQFDDCDAGLWCRTIEGSQDEGICTALCSAIGEGVCPNDQVCLTPFDNDIGVCGEPCDPLAAVPCPADNLACLPAGFSFACMLDLGEQEVGEPCWLDAECSGAGPCREDPARTCGYERCCEAWCDLNDPQCEGDAPCIPYESPLSAHANLGHCAAPTTE